MENRKLKKAISVEYRETKPVELIEYLKTYLQAFVLLNYIAAWQEYQFRELFESLPANIIIS
jgi:hypothetical protein